MPYIKTKESTGSSFLLSPPPHPTLPPSDEFLLFFTSKYSCDQHSGNVNSLNLFCRGVSFSVFLGGIRLNVYLLRLVLWCIIIKPKIEPMALLVLGSRAQHINQNNDDD